MPAKNATKPYVANAFYHLYNRGVEKRILFIDDQDYSVIFSYLKTYLLPKHTLQLQQIIANPAESYHKKDEARRELRLNNFADSIKLVAFCLMPNHFHMLVKQSESNAIDVFMNSLWTRYTMYFNAKYKRVGTLFQDVYKAVMMETNEQLLYLTRYIHRNPFSLLGYRKLASKGDALRGEKLEQYPWSSYDTYLGINTIQWVHPEEILAYFSSNQRQQYRSFIESSDENEQSERILSSLQLDS